ncbi:unnamed protein product [marine sediment metagenome]|uniref:Uncharacterized protein n=1 Tax=marine sediment metagenome TaxID=412755 RepID=X0XF61_9ZZZZ
MSDVSEEFTCDDWMYGKNIIYLITKSVKEPPEPIEPWLDRVVHIISLHNIRRIEVIRE